VQQVLLQEVPQLVLPQLVQQLQQLQVLLVYQVLLEQLL
jgi:hypothetical protein